jgi:hypothetical protein
MGRLVIETNKETGLDEVELTLDNGKVWRFKGKGESELRLIPGYTEMINVGTPDDPDAEIPGQWHPDTFTFEVNIEDIPSVDITEPSEGEDATGDSDLAK